MDTFELKKEQSKLARRIESQDRFSKIKTIGGAACVNFGEKLLACVVVCDFPSMKVKEFKTFLLHNPLPYKSGFKAYREMPAIVEAYDLLQEEPDVLLVNGNGILHPRKCGVASHVGLALNQPTIGVVDKLVMGKVENGKILLNSDIVGFEIKTREFANPVYTSPGHLVSLGSTLNIISKTIKHPHKMPEPLHLANKLARKEVKNAARS